MLPQHDVNMQYTHNPKHRKASLMNTASVTDRVVDIDPTLISPDPANPRTKLRDIDAMASSIALHGVLEPISVRPDPDHEGRFLIHHGGHRRHAGALKAGVKSIPCMVDGNEDAKLAATRRMVVNIQRDDFSATELSRGVQQLMDLGMDEADIASGLSVAPAAVAEAAKVARSDKAMAIAEKHELTFDQALALAEFDDDKDVLVHLTTTAVQNPGSFDHVAQRYRRAKAREEAIAAATAEQKEKGLTIVDKPAWNSDGPLARLDQLIDPATDKRLTAAKHKTCPGNAVYVDIDHDDKVHVIACCTDWRSNGHKNQFATGKRGDAKESKSEAQKEAESIERREHRAGLDASKAAQEVRRNFVKGLLTRKVPPKGLIPFVVAQIVREHDGLESRQASMFGQLVGIDATNSYNGHIDVQVKYLSTITGGRELYVLLARVCAEREHDWEPNTWQAKDDKRKAYLDFLILNGYTPSTVESVGMGKAKGADVLAERDAEKARLKVTKASQPKATPAKKAPAKKVAKKRVPAKKAIKRAPARKRAAARS